MIGEDCKRFEANIEKFVRTFLKENEVFEGNSFEKMRQVINLHHDFKDFAIDIRATNYTKDLAHSFQGKAEKYKIFFGAMEFLFIYTAKGLDLKLTP